MRAAVLCSNLKYHRVNAQYNQVRIVHLDLMYALITAQVLMLSLLRIEWKILQYVVVLCSRCICWFLSQKCCMFLHNWRGEKRYAGIFGSIFLHKCTAPSRKCTLNIFFFITRLHDRYYWIIRLFMAYTRIYSEPPIFMILL